MWRTGEYWRQWLSQGTFPDHPWRSYLQSSALALKGLSYAPTGALLAAATTSLPETPGGERNWDYRYTWIRDSTFALWGLYTLGLRPRGQRLLLLHPRRLPGQPERPADHVRRRRRAAPGGGHPGPPHRLRRRPPGPDRQRRLQPAAARRLGRPAGLDLPAHPVPRADARGTLADRHRPGRAGRRALAGAGPRHLGGARRAAALHRVEDHVLGRAGPRRAAGPAARLARHRRQVAGDRRRDPRRHPGQRRRRARACWSSGTAPTPWTPRCCWPRWCASCRRTTPGSGPPCWRSPTNSPTRAWCCGTGSRRPTTAWPARRAPSPSARSGWSRRWWRSARYERAHALCERLLSHASTLGLYAEELDPITGRHLGNFPQAFTHLALINAVTHVIRAEESLPGARFRPGQPAGLSGTPAVRPLGITARYRSVDRRG